MNSIKKHSFEAVSLLTADNGVLDVTIIPAVDQLDWVIPSNLILSVDEYDERIWTYLWKNQEVSVYHLLPREEKPDKLIVLEGNTDVHRIAIQTKGELRTKQVRISDVKDTDLPEALKEKVTIEHETQDIDETVEQSDTIGNEDASEAVDTDISSTDEVIDSVDTSSNDNNENIVEESILDDSQANPDKEILEEDVVEEEVIDLVVPEEPPLIDDNFLIDDDALIDDNFVLEEKEESAEEPEYESFVIESENVPEEEENEDTSHLEEQFNETLVAEIRNAHDIKFPYIFQSVMIDNELFLVPDLDTISHRLVDLDG